MRATAGTSPQSLIPIPPSQGDNFRTPAPTDSDSSTSFQDVLRQHADTTPKSDQKKTAPSDKKAAASPTASDIFTSVASKTDAPVDPKNDPAQPTATLKAPGANADPATTPDNNPFASLLDTNDPASMLARIALLTSCAQQLTSSRKTPAAATSTDSSANPDPTANAATDTSSPVAGATDLSTMMVQALIAAANAAQTPATAPATAPVTTTATAPATTTATAPATTTTTAPVTTTATAPATAMAAAMATTTATTMAATMATTTATTMAATTTTNAAASTATATIATTIAAGKDLPLLGLTKGATASPLKEKKSGTSSVEGSFLQATTTSTPTDASAKNLVGQPLITISQLSALQQFTTTKGAKNSSPANLLDVTSSVAGTANVEKTKAMTPDIVNSQIAALSGLGTQGSALRQTPADVHILLSSNNDFQDALKQVMHVAQLTQTADTRTPMRVAIEIQTPPGAIVNVYVSRQNDQWRAQLSTNDPQALTWVQDKMNSIRSGDVGVDVKWLPPQMESSNTGGNTNSNLGWDRGGQNQSNYQQPDERSQSQRQRNANPEPELEVVGASAFMNTFATIQEAA